MRTSRRLSGAAVAVGLTMLILVGTFVWLGRAGTSPPTLPAHPETAAGERLDLQNTPESGLGPFARELEPGPGPEVSSVARPIASGNEESSEVPAVAVPANSSPLERLSRALDELDRLFEDPGELSAAEASRLLERRREEKARLVETVAALGDGGASAVAAALFDSEPPLSLRDRLLLVEGLTRLDDPDVVPLLAELLESEADVSLRKSVLAALARRSEPQVVEVLDGVLSRNDPGHLHVAAVRALAGRNAGLPMLERVVVEGAVDTPTRLEALQSIAATGNERAKESLLRLAKDQTMESPVRAAAIQALGREFGASVLSALERLAEDPDLAVRRSVTKAMSRVEKGAAK